MRHYTHQHTTHRAGARRLTKRERRRLGGQLTAGAAGDGLHDAMEGLRDAWAEYVQQLLARHVPRALELLRMFGDKGVFPLLTGLRDRCDSRSHRAFALPRLVCQSLRVPCLHLL